MKSRSIQPLSPALLAVAVMAMTMPMADPSAGAAMQNFPGGLPGAGASRAWVRNDRTDDTLAAQQWLASLTEAARTLHGQHHVVTSAALFLPAFSFVPQRYVTTDTASPPGAAVALAHHLVDLPPPVL